MYVKNLCLKNGIYYNDSLEQAISDKSIDFLKCDLTRDGPVSLERIDKRLGLNFDGPFNGMSLDDYLNEGERLISSLGFRYHRFTTEKVLAYMNAAEDQQRIMPWSDTYDWAIGHLGEQVLREKLISDNKRFVSRAILYDNSGNKQLEKDFKIYMGDIETQVGAKCHRVFSNEHLYSSNRIAHNKNDIGDYIVFSHHFGHHILFITGVVEKELLTSRINWTGDKMSQFPFYEDTEKADYFYQGSWGFLNVNNVMSDEEKEQKMIEVLKRRISFDDFMSRIDILPM